MIGYLLWAVLLTGLVVVEGVALTARGSGWPSVSDMFRAVTRPVVGRWLFFALWLWAGWHLFIRGWHFLLRGKGAGNPGNPTAGQSFASTVVHVVLPLFVLYAMLLAALGLARRQSVRTGGSARDPHAGAQLAREQPRAFVMWVAWNMFAAYLAFVGAIAVYQLIAGRGASGLTGSAVLYGAFLAFVVAVPVFLGLTFAEAALTKARGRPRLPTTK